MASVRHNVVSDPFQGRVGLIVFRRLYGRLYVGSRPNASDKPPTADQVAQRAVFVKAMEYSKGALADPVKRAAYERLSPIKQMSPFAVAMRDWFHPPQVLEILADGYHGQIGEAIVVRAYDDAEVVSVQVVIRQSDGTLVEKGEAVVQPDNGWRYVATAATPANAPLIIEATARDRVGNAGVKNLNIP
jgi:hypothetical protein